MPLALKGLKITEQRPAETAKEPASPVDELKADVADPLQREAGNETVAAVEKVKSAGEGAEKVKIKEGGEKSTAKIKAKCLACLCWNFFNAFF